MGQRSAEALWVSLGWLCLLLCPGLAAGCLSRLEPYKPEIMHTRRILFCLDRRFNQGQLLAGGHRVHHSQEHAPAGVGHRGGPLLPRLGLSPLTRMPPELGGDRRPDGVYLHLAADSRRFPDASGQQPANATLALFPVALLEDAAGGGAQALGPAQGLPAAYSGRGPAHDLETEVPFSQGDDDPGLALGVASGMVMGPCRHLPGAFTVLLDGLPATRLLVDLTGQDGESPNALGANLVPAQVKVLCLAP